MTESARISPWISPSVMLEITFGQMSAEWRMVHRMAEGMIMQVRGMAIRLVMMKLTGNVLK